MITLQNWLEQEYKSWINEGAPGGSSSGWVKDAVVFDGSEWQPNVRIDSDGEITLGLRPIPREGVLV